VSNAKLIKASSLGVLWQVGGGLWLTLVRLGASTMLARLLYPADFGLFGMAMIARELIVVVCNLGMSTGLIAKKQVNAEDLDTAFWFMVGVRGIMCAATILFAPVAALFFGDPRVTDVMRVISLTFLLTPFSDIGVAILRRKLHFKKLALLNGFAALIESTVAVLLAFYMHLGYWSLIIGMLINTIVLNIGVISLARWWPKMRFSLESYRYLFRYGINGLGFGVVNYLNQNIDYLLVGRILGTTSLGLYEFAYKIPHMVLDRISRPVGSVLFPALSKVQNDNAYLLTGFIKTIKIVTLFSFPAMIGLSAVADIFVQVLWGERWTNIIVPLQILSISAALRTIGQPVGSIFYCKDRPDLPFKYSLLIMVVTFSAVGFLGNLYGMVGVAFGMTISVLPTFYVVHHGLKLVGGRLSILLREIFPGFVASISCGIIAYTLKNYLLCHHIGDILTLVFSVSAGAIVYILVLKYIFSSTWDEFLGLREIINSKT